MADHRLNFWSVSNHLVWHVQNMIVLCSSLSSFLFFFFICCRSVTRALFRGPMLIGFFQIGGPMFLKHSFFNIRWSSVQVSHLHSHTPFFVYMCLIWSFFLSSYLWLLFLHFISISCVIAFFTRCFMFFLYFLSIFSMLIDLVCTFCTLAYFFWAFSFFCSNLLLPATHALAMRSFF